MEPPVCGVTADKAHTLVTDQISESWSQPSQSLSSRPRSVHRECVALWKTRRKWKREREGSRGIFLGDGFCWGLSWWFPLPRDVVLLPSWRYGTDRRLGYFFYQDCQTSLSWTRAVVQRSVLKKKSHVLFKRTLVFSKRTSLETIWPILTG